MSNALREQQMIGAPATVRVTAKDFSAKYKSKREVYNFLSVDVGVYLPHYGKCHLDPLLMIFLCSCRAGDDLLPEGHHAWPEEE